MGAGQVGVAGGTDGYNWHHGHYLFGIESDYAWSSLNGSAICGSGSQCGTEMNAFGTARSRSGLVSHDMLTFVTGGWAFADVRASDLFHPQQGTKFRTGWTIGGRIENKLHDSVSLKAEYLYADFGAREHFTNAGHTPEEFSFEAHVLRLGINLQ